MTDIINVGTKNSSCFSSEGGSINNQFSESNQNTEESDWGTQSQSVGNNDNKNSRRYNNSPLVNNNNSMGEHVLKSESNRESMSQNMECISQRECDEINEMIHKINNDDLNKSQPENNTEWRGERITPQDSVGSQWKLPPGLAEELMELQDTNEALKGLLRRNNGKGLAEIHYRLEKTERSLKEKTAILKEERDNHKKTESKYIEYKSQAQKIIFNKDSEIKKLTDVILSLRAENALIKDRYKESESIVQIGTTENLRLLQLCKQNNIPVPAYTDNTIGKTVRQDRVQSAVPSTKKYLRMSHGVYPNECVSVPRNKSSTRDERSTTPNNRYRRGTQISSISANGFRNDQMSPNQFTSDSTITNEIRTQAGDVLYVGQEATWKGLTGVIRYIGPVDELHRGTWVGCEFDEGRGEHSGNILGIHYFTAAPRSSVFCRPEELGPSRTKVSTNLEAVKKDVKARMKSPGRPSKFYTSGDSRTNFEKEASQTPQKGDDLTAVGSYKVPPPPSTMKRAESPGSTTRMKSHQDSDKKKKPNHTTYRGTEHQ